MAHVTLGELGLAFHLEGGPRSERLLVLLHGFGATPNDIAAVVPHVDPAGRYAVVAPRGPIELPGGGASWYDFDERWAADPASFHTTLAALDLFVDGVCGAFGTARSEVVIGGFSQGAGMAAWLSFATASPAPAGFWCCGTIVEVGGHPLGLSPAHGCSCLVLAGRSDPNVPLERSRDQAHKLERAGGRVTLSEHDGGHGLSRPMLDDMRVWLAAFPPPSGSGGPGGPGSARRGG